VTDFVAYLKDKHEIEQVYIRYCDLIDQKDFASLDEVFTEDCIGDYRSTNGTIQQGLAPLIAHVTRGMGPGSDCGRPITMSVTSASRSMATARPRRPISMPSIRASIIAPASTIPAGANMTTSGPAPNRAGASAAGPTGIS
jgi:hypothetical protein